MIMKRPVDGSGVRLADLDAALDRVEAEGGQ
jgi:hypothetical protein